MHACICIPHPCHQTLPFDSKKKKGDNSSNSNIPVKVALFNSYKNYFI